MSNLRDIKHSITEIPWEAQLEIHRQVRVSRYTPKKPIKAKKRKEVSVTKKLMKSIDEMTLEELEALQERLKDRKESQG